MTKPDFRQYERQAQALAAGASPEARDALEQLINAMRADFDVTPAPAPRLGRSQTLTAIVASLIVFSIYLPTALWIGSSYVPVTRPPGQMVETLLRIDAYGGFAWRARSYTFAEYADRSATDQRSPIIIYEDLTPLGHGHIPLREINKKGLGRFAHVNEHVHQEGHIDEYLFSTRDNSDPRTNGRHYWAVLP